MKYTVGLIDYGAGNIFSLENALRGIKCNVVTASTPAMLKGIDKLILPGVGAFPEGMKNLHSLGFTNFLNEHVNFGGHLLGICLGMQLMLSFGKEGQETKGLNIINGSVELLPPTKNYRIPHIGWNNVSGNKFDALDLFSGIELGTSFYFLHSYHVVPSEDMRVVYTSYANLDIVAAYQKGGVFGVQFHPEKSQTAGVKLLQNFLEFEAL